MIRRYVNYHQSPLEWQNFSMNQLSKVTCMLGYLYVLSDRPALCSHLPKGDHIIQVWLVLSEPDNNTRLSCHLGTYHTDLQNVQRFKYHSKNMWQRCHITWDKNKTLQQSSPTIWFWHSHKFCICLCVIFASFIKIQDIKNGLENKEWKPACLESVSELSMIYAHSCELDRSKAL